VSGAAFLRLKKLKGSGIIAAAARHNRRAIQAEVGASASIDSGRSGLNESLHGPPTADGVAQLASRRLREAGIAKLRKNAVMALEIVFSLPLGSGLDERRFFGDCAAWVAQSFGGSDNILSVDIHRDEAAPHCHVLILPLIGGRMVGSDLVGNRPKLMALHQDFHQAVAARYGLKKAPARLAGAAKQRAAAAVLAKLQSAADSALRSTVWPTIRDVIEHDPGPFLMPLCLDLKQPKKKLRTMTQIFTSKGKGKPFENPIGIARPPEPRTLCPVGIESPAPPLAPSASALASAPCTTRSPTQSLQIETTRERDADQDPALYDPDIGEFRRLAELPAKARAGLVAWSDAQIGEDHSTDVSNDPQPLDWEHQA
jgi:hypothetical protein